MDGVLWGGRGRERSESDLIFKVFSLSTCENGVVIAEMGKIGGEVGWERFLIKELVWDTLN